MYGYERASSTIKSILMTHGSLLGVRYTVSYIRWIQPYADAGLVYYWERLALSDEYSELIERDWTLGIVGEIGLLIFPRVRFGFLINIQFALVGV